MNLVPLFGYSNTGIPADAVGNADYQSKMLANLQTMRQNERERIDRQRTEKQREVLMAPVDGVEDLPSGAPAPMSAGIPVTASAPTDAPANTGSFVAGTSVPNIRRTQYTNANVTPAVTPNQSDAETKRLASHSPNKKPGILDTVAAVTTMPGALAMEPAAQQQRYADLKAKNPSVSSGGNESPAEAKRLLDKPVPAATADFDTLAQAVKMVESGGNPNAVSPKGAVGTMQTMPETLRDPGFGVRPAQNDSPQELERVGRDYLQAMLKRYPGRVDHALAAYNWGPGNADNWIAAGADPARLPRETREYIPKVLGRLGGQQPTQTAAAPQTQTPGAAPAPQAQAAATPPMQFTPEQVNQLAVATDQELRMINMKLAEVNRQLAVAPTAAQAVQLRTQANDLRFGAYGAQLKNAFVQGISGNQDAIGQLANAAGVQYAQTPQGFVAVRLDPAKGQYVAVTEPAPMHVFVRQMYDEASGAAARAREAQAKLNGEIAVERAKGDIAMITKQLESNLALRNKLAEARINENDIEGITFSPDGSGRALIRTKRGVIQYNPEQDMGDGVPAPAGLSNLPIPQ
jgi:hypothetical protein